MARLALLLAALVWTPLLGCAAAGPMAPTHRPRVASVAPLFDRHLGPYASEDFTYRLEWPAAPRPHDPGETILYVEFTYDIEGRHGFYHDQTRREFRSYRTGLVQR